MRAAGRIWDILYCFSTSAAQTKRPADSRRDSGATLTRVQRAQAIRGKTTAIRWLKFNAVGAVGIAVQLTTLAFLKSGLHIQYGVATALAVEAAVLHNFFWHERFTWADRASVGAQQSLVRLLKFNLSTGIFSILGNVVLMMIFVGTIHIPYVIANLLTIACCSIVTFVMSDRLVYTMRDLRT